MNCYNPFNDNNLTPNKILDDIEQQFYIMALSGNFFLQPDIHNINDYKKYVKYANKYKLSYSLIKSNNKFKIQIYIGQEQSDNNFIQNKYFEIKKILNNYLIDDHYCELFKSKSIYKKICDNKINNICTFDLNSDITLDEIHELEHIGKHCGYTYQINNNILIVENSNSKLIYKNVFDYPKEYYIQILLFKLNSMIVDGILNNKTEVYNTKFSLIGRNNGYENDFWNICKKYLSEKNMDLIFYEETIENFDGKSQCDYFCVKNICNNDSKL